MAGIDKNNIFPNSKMAQAARLGQSLFRSVESTTVALATTETEIVTAAPPPAPEPLPKE